MTKSQLSEAVEAYGEYLQLGLDARNPLSRRIASTLPPGCNSAVSLGPKNAAIRKFLGLSESIRQEMAEMAQWTGNKDVVIDEGPLLPELGRRRALRPSEVRAMQANSMLAGVIAGGPKLINDVALTSAVGDIPYEHDRAFPYDKVLSLIYAMPTYRDKAFYALLAASGCRTHEALQLLSEDIDVLDGSVQLVDPGLRVGHSSYRALSADERSILAWKGRATSLTLLIEPFASAFFESLKGYFECEHIAHGKHEFVFQYLTGKGRGKPYFLSSAASRLELFHKACRRINVELPPRTGAHSLRHMYGTYLLNYFPRPNGEYGLPPAMVQQLMGHADLKSTFKYARYDRDLIRLELENANNVIFADGEPKRFIDLKIAALESQLARLQSQMGTEAIARD